MTTLPAISLWQPWATLIATRVPCPNGHDLDGEPCLPEALARRPMVKRYETRSRPCPPKYIGQRIAIHAAKHRPDEKHIGPVYQATAWHIPGTAQRGWALEHVDDGTVCDLAFGAVVATAIVTASLPIVSEHSAVPTGLGRVERTDQDLLHHVYSDSWDDLTDQLPYGDWTPGRFAWQLDDVQPLEQPVPATGRQGWFTVKLS